MASQNKRNNLNDQDSQKERLFDPKTCLRFADRKPSMAGNNTNNNQDRRTVEQWQLDNTNAAINELASRLEHCEEEVATVGKNHIDLTDTVHDAVGNRAMTKAKTVQGRNFLWKLVSFFCLISKALLLLAAIMLLVLVILYLYGNYEGNFLNHFLDLVDIDFGNYF
ncbi:hypothetical protein FLONG3_8977 [Fusarium longipes]|uniref:Uncharacterized protein n=1 Tax=Fusarium longipes TaxID=694270 RepID=A0A395S1S1_9HYPO|nr:hypothetical protein FLONG3_8977 [Fusarium longipes]